MLKILIHVLTHNWPFLTYFSRVRWSKSSSEGLLVAAFTQNSPEVSPSYRNVGNLQQTENYKDLTQILLTSGWYIPTISISSAEEVLISRAAGNFMIVSADKEHWKQQFEEFPALRVGLLWI